MELKDYLFDNDVDICAITETWLDSTISSTEFCPDDYICFRKDRDLSFYEEETYTLRDRGGSLLLVKRNLNPTLYAKGDVDAEVVGVKFTQIRKLKFCVELCTDLREEVSLIWTRYVNPFAR